MPKTGEKYNVTKVFKQTKKGWSGYGFFKC